METIHYVREILFIVVVASWLFYVVWGVIDSKRKRKDIARLETYAINMKAAADEFSQAMKGYNLTITGQNPALLLMQNLVLAADGIPHEAAQLYLQHGPEALRVLKMLCGECKSNHLLKDKFPECSVHDTCPAQIIINKLEV